MENKLQSKIEQLKYEISLLGLNSEELTSVNLRIEELESLINNYSDDNKAFVIQIDDNKYLSKNDSVTSKIRNSNLYNDEIHAKHELDLLIDKYKGTECVFLNGECNFSIRKVEVNIIE